MLCSSVCLFVLCLVCSMLLCVVCLVCWSVVCFCLFCLCVVHVVSYFICDWRAWFAVYVVCLFVCLFVCLLFFVCVSVFEFLFACLFVCVVFYVVCVPLLVDRRFAMLTVMFVSVFVFA